jgi:hypothetical protein
VTIRAGANFRESLEAAVDQQDRRQQALRAVYAGQPCVRLDHRLSPSDAHDRILREASTFMPPLTSVGPQVRLCAVVEALEAGRTRLPLQDNVSSKLVYAYV